MAALIHMTFTGTRTPRTIISPRTVPSSKRPRPGTRWEPLTQSATPKFALRAPPGPHGSSVSKSSLRVRRLESLRSLNITPSRSAAQDATSCSPVLR